MVKDDKNLKDMSSNSIKDSNSGLSVYGGFANQAYTKTNKLITALYMVTDIMDQNEPLRQKLRTLGAEIVSDVYSLSIFPSINNSMQAIGKISETLSFLEISTSINLISPMNSNILKKEFIQLKKAIEDTIQKNDMLDNQNTLLGFFEEELPSTKNEISEDIATMGQSKYSFPVPTRLGVQKASTLMKAISDRTSQMSNRGPSSKTMDSFDELKQNRRNEIILVIKGSGNTGATITEIKSKAKGVLVSVGEKTLQRELVSMVKDNILKKTGEKRWSRYFLTK
jgi:hypothetical protein